MWHGRLARDFPEAKNTGEVPVPRLSQDALHEVPRYIREAIVPTLEFEGQSFVIDSQEMENRRLQIMGIDGIGDDVVAEFIGLPEGRPAIDAGAGHPDREGI